MPARKATKTTNIFANIYDPESLFVFALICIWFIAMRRRR